MFFGVFEEFGSARTVRRCVLLCYCFLEAFWAFVGRINRFVFAFSFCVGASRGAFVSVFGAFEPGCVRK